MSALFKGGGKPTLVEDWARLADRRSAPIVDRLRAGLFLRYREATGAREFDLFLRDAKTWALFEHAVLPELANFTFYDKDRDIYLSAPAVLAEGMFHIWTATEARPNNNNGGPPTTIGIVGELANYLCATYQATRVDRRKRRRRWLPI